MGRVCSRVEQVQDEVRPRVHLQWERRRNACRNVDDRQFEVSRVACGHCVGYPVGCLPDVSRSGAARCAAPGGTRGHLEEASRSIRGALQIPCPAPGIVPSSEAAKGAHGVRVRCAEERERGEVFPVVGAPQKRCQVLFQESGVGFVMRS